MRTPRPALCFSGPYYARVCNVVFRSVALASTSSIGLDVCFTPPPRRGLCSTHYVMADDRMACIPDHLTAVTEVRVYEYVPVDGNGHQGEHAGAYGQHGHELADLAVGRAERPVAGQHVAEVD